jgi:hypothetical protein
MRAILAIPAGPAGGAEGMAMPASREQLPALERGGGGAVANEGSTHEGSTNEGSIHQGSTNDGLTDESSLRLSMKWRAICTLSLNPKP